MMIATQANATYGESPVDFVADPGFTVVDEQM